MLRRFHEAFGIRDDFPQEQTRFVERINQTALAHIQKMTYPASYENIFRQVCYWLGSCEETRFENVAVN